MSLSPQSITLLVVYILLMVIALILNIKAKQFTAGSIVGLIFTSLFLVLTVYDTNCLTSGSCGIWSWVRTVIYLIIPVLALIFMALSLFKKKDEKKVIPKTQ